MTTQRVGESRSLLELASRLVADLRQLIDQRLELLKAELTQEATRAAKNVGMLVAGAVGASIGVAFLLLALGLWVGHLVGSAPGGLAIVGGGLVLTGAGLGLLARQASGTPTARSADGPRAAKGRRMDSQRSVDMDRLRRDIEATRASISRTTGELREKAGEAMQWQTYFERYPATILGFAALAGVAVGRRIARGLKNPRPPRQ